MARKSFKYAVLVTSLLLFLIGSAQAEPYNSARYEQVEKSDIIVVGSVLKVDKETAEIKIDKTLKGSLQEKEITVSPITVQDCVGEYKNFRVNEEVVLFLKKTESSSFTVIDGGWGKSTLKQQTKETDIKAIQRVIEIMELPEVGDRDKAMLGEATSSNPLLRAEFHRYIASRISHSELRQNYKDELIALLKNKDEDVQLAALQGIQFVKAEEAVPLMIEATHSKNRVIVFCASQALSRYYSEESVKARVALTESSDPEIRCRACIDLAQCAHPEAKKAIEKLLDDTEAEVRAIAAGQLVYRLRGMFVNDKGDSIIPKLVSMLNDSSEEVAARAASSLGASRSLQPVKPLLDILRKDKIGEELESRVVGALGGLYSGGGDEARKLINNDLSLIIGSLERGRWVPSLGAVGILSQAATPEALEALKRAAKSHPCEDVRQYAQRELERKR